MTFPVTWVFQSPQQSTTLNTHHHPSEGARNMGWWQVTGSSEASRPQLCQLSFWSQILNDLQLTHDCKTNTFFSRKTKTFLFYTHFWNLDSFSPSGHQPFIPSLSFVVCGGLKINQLNSSLISMLCPPAPIPSRTWPGKVPTPAWC